LTDLKGILKRFAPVRALYTSMHASATRVRGARRRLARVLLTAGLVAVYVLLVTPVALVRRVFGRSLAHPGRQSGRGWQPIRQSTADKRIYIGDF
jgi:hypothetical protein